MSKVRIRTDGCSTRGSAGRVARGCAAARLRNPRRPRPWRVRRHLPGARHDARPRCRDQGISADGARGPRRRHHGAAAVDRISPRSSIWGRDRFLEEARILAKLDGAPAIVRVFDFLEANGTAYMVMALLDGEIARAAPQARRTFVAAGCRKHPLSPARRPRGGPCDGLPASRHQAGQHHARCQGCSDADRLRRLARSDGRPHHGDDRDLHAGLCPGRAIHLGQAGPVDRHLWPLRHPLSRHHRPPAAQRLRPHGERYLPTPGEAVAGGFFIASSERHRCRARDGTERPSAIDRRLAPDARPCVGGPNARPGGPSRHGRAASVC